MTADEITAQRQSWVRGQTGGPADVQQAQMADLIGLAQALAELLEDPATFEWRGEHFAIGSSAKIAIAHKARRILPLCRALTAP